MSVSADGLLLCTTSDDKALKIFDVINFGEHNYLHTQSVTIHVAGCVKYTQRVLADLHSELYTLYRIAGNFSLVQIFI